MTVHQLLTKMINIEAAALGREKIHQPTIDDYAEILKAGGALPPATVFVDGTGNWLADGLHRLRAHEKTGAKEIPAEIKTGGLREATLWAMGANSEHGLPRTRADKQKAVAMMLADAEWGLWSDYKIAEICKVSREMVNNHRKATIDFIEQNKTPIEIIEKNDGHLPNLASDGQIIEQNQSRKFADSRGRTNTMRTTNIGRRIIEAPDLADELSEARKTIADLAEENESLCLSAMPETEQIAKIRSLEAELNVTRHARDVLMAENAALKRQCQALQRKIKALTP